MKSDLFQAMENKRVCFGERVNLQAINPALQNIIKFYKDNITSSNNILIYVYHEINYNFCWLQNIFDNYLFYYGTPFLKSTKITS